MIIDENKLNIAKARAGLSLLEIGIYPRLMKRIKEGKPIQTRTLHRIAAALKVDPAELIRDEQEG